MKRLASFLLALSMAFTMAAPAFAENSASAPIPSSSVTELLPFMSEGTSFADESIPTQSESIPADNDSIPTESPSDEADSASVESNTTSTETDPTLEANKSSSAPVVQESFSTEETSTFAAHRSAYFEVTDLSAITADGTYIIAVSSSNSATILYNKNGSAKSDQVTGTLTDNELQPASNFAEASQTWNITPADGGFTIQGVDSQTFINFNSATDQNARVPLSATAQTLSITKTNGGFTIGNTVNGQTFYIHHADKQQYNVSTEASILRIFKQTTVIDKNELTAAVKKAEDFLKTADDFSQESKNALQSALDTANAEIKNTASTEESVRNAANALSKALQAMAPKAEKIASGAPANGTTEGQPFPVGMAGSKTFRIPAITTLQNGWLAAAIDARWDACPDGYGIDTLFSVSKDNGKTWEYTFPNFFNDSTNAYDAKEKKSTSFLDPVMVQGKDGTIYLMTDVFPGGNYILTVDNATGYEKIGDKLRLVLYTSPNKGQNSTNYSYYVNDFSKAEGETKAFAPVIDKNNQSNIAYYVDDHYYLYTADKKPMYCRQIGSDQYVQQNVFFYNADLHVRNATYLWLVTSKDNGQTWSAPTIMNPMVRPDKEGKTHRFYGVGPGAGLALKDGTVMLTCYINDASTQEKSSFIYTRDNGQTWHRSDNATTGNDWSSESALVQINDTTVRQFCRDGYSVLRYTDHVWDEATQTWKRQGDPVQLKDVPKTEYNQLSAIRYSKLINGKPAIMVSTATMPGRHRTRGKIYTFTLNDDKTMTLIGSYQITKGGTSKEEPGVVYGYSSLTELADGSIGLLYEETFNNSKYINIPLDKLVPGAIVDGQRNVEVPLFGTFEDYFAPLPSENDLKTLDSSIVTAEIKNDKVIFTGIKEGTTSFTSNGITTNVKVVSTYPIEQIKINCKGEHKITIGVKNAIVNNNKDIISATLDPITVTGGQGTTGNNSSYNGTAEPLACALYTFHKNGEGFQVSAQTADGTMTWVDPTAANGFPFATQAGSVQFVPNGENAFFLLGGESRYLYFWPNGKDKYSYDAVSKTQGFESGCSFKLYRPVNKNETSSTELPGYVATGTIEDGGKYLIVSQADGSNYVMRPSVNSTNRFDHVLKVNAAAQQTTTTVGNILTFKAQKTGTANILVNGTVYQVTARHKLIHANRVEPTATKPGNVEYWHCEICGLNFADEAGTKVLNSIVLPATGNPLVPIQPGKPVQPTPTPAPSEKPNSSENSTPAATPAPAPTSAPAASSTSPVTGDNNHFGLLVAVVVLAGGGIGILTYLGKRKSKK